MREGQCSETWLFLGERYCFPSSLQAVVAHSPIFHVPMSLEVDLMSLSFLTVTSWTLLLHFQVKTPALWGLYHFLPLIITHLPTIIHPSDLLCQMGLISLKSCHQSGCLQYDLCDTWPPGFLTVHSFCCYCIN